MKLKERIKQLIEELNHDVFEKEEITRLTLLSAIAGESLFLMGAPGVAKSLIARRLKFAFKNVSSFEYLMNKFSTPDEIFGPISIKKLKEEDKYERLTENYLPSSNIAFLDEIWKAGPSIQNTLLTILNEKKYRNGEQEKDCNIYGMIAASNELPEQNQGLEALWDRFLIRYFVKGISDKENFNRMITENLKSYEDNVTTDLKFSNEEIEDWSKQIDAVAVPDEVLNVIHFIRSHIQEYNEKKKVEEIYISDRRWRKIVRLLRASAFLNDRKSVDLMDCFLISFCIWNEQDQLETVQNIVAETIKKHGYGIGLPLSAIWQEIKQFNDEEVIKATTFIEEYQVEEVLIVDKDFYEIEGINYNQTYNRIKIADYNTIGTSQINKNFYNSNNSAVQWTTHKSGDNLMIASNNWDTCTLKKHNVKKKKTIKRPPTSMLKKSYDEKVKELNDLIQKQVNKVESHKKVQLAHLKTNLFVESHLAEIVEANLNDIVKELGVMKFEVEKIKDYYDNIK